MPRCDTRVPWLCCLTKSSEKVSCQIAMGRSLSRGFPTSLGRIVRRRECAHAARPLRTKQHASRAGAFAAPEGWGGTGRLFESATERGFGVVADGEGDGR